jgi:putative ABC transport system permease protein
VRDAKHLQMREERTAAEARFSSAESAAMFLPIAYLAVSQNAGPPPDFRILVRADLSVPALTRALTAIVTEVAPGASVSYDTVTNFIEGLIATERLIAWLSGLFGLLAMLIAAIGLYGVMSYIVTRRRIEIGVRMALGAEPREMIRMVLVEAGVLLAIGIVIGVGLAGVASRYAASLLFGLTPLDPASFAIGMIGLAIVSLLAAWVPARRASRLAPASVLRE